MTQPLVSSLTMKTGDWNSDLSAKILALLEKAEHPLRATEIAATLSKNGDMLVTRKAVNQCLYGTALRECLQQDGNHRWFLKPSATVNNSAEQTRRSRVVKMKASMREDTRSMLTSEQMIEEFIDALDEEIEAIKKGKGGSIVKVFNGRFLRKFSDLYVYAFKLENFLAVLDESPAEIIIRGNRCQAQVFSTRGLEVEIGIEHFCGQFIPEASLQTNLWYLLKMLRDRFAEYQGGPAKTDFTLSEFLFSGNRFDVVSNDQVEVRYSPSEPLPNEHQVDAIKASVSSRLSVIWGPPGTGKTKTIAKAIEAHLNVGRRVLLVSHANNAVDEALEGVAKQLKTNPLYWEGKLVRLGKPREEYLKKLQENYERVLLDNIAEKLGESLVQERNELEVKKNGLEGVISQLDNVLRVIEKVEKTSAAVDALRSSVLELNSKMDDTWVDLGHLEQEQVRNRERLSEARSAGMFRRLFRGFDPRKIQLKIDQTSQAIDVKKHLLEEMGIRLKELRNSYHSKESELKEARVEANTVLKQLGMFTADEIVKCPRCGTKNIVREHSAGLRLICGKCKAPLPSDFRIEYPSERLEEQKQQYEQQRDEVLARITEIDRQLDEIQKRVLSEARLVATTLTQTFTAKTFPDEPFDVLIVDEVSMAPLPYLYWAASRCRSFVTIVGDFLQLPPICIAEKKPMAWKWLGRSIFDVLGIDDVRKACTDPRVELLEIQYRMCPKIAEIPNRFIYDYRLEDDKSTFKYAEDDGVSDWPLVLVETASENPWCSRLSTQGRFNLYNALVCVSLAKRILEKTPDTKIGIVTPYSAQARLTNKIAKDWNLLDNLRISNVHKFQGGEEPTIIFDSVEASGARVAPMLDEKSGLRSDAPKLLNVAITRARDRLYFVGHTEHLLSDLHSDSVLARIIHHLYENAEIVASKELVDDYFTSDFEEQAGTLMPVSDLPRQSVPGELYTERNFWSQFFQDLKTVGERLIILSPFLTIKRSGDLMNYFRAMVEREVDIYIHTRPPKQQIGDMVDQAEVVIEQLLSMGIKVIQRNRMHQKIAILDDSIAWEGSLNILSHRDTEEHMRRFAGSSAMEEIIRNLELDEKWPVGMVTDLKCSKSGHRMIVRRGRYGKFLGCLSYPSCKNTMELPRDWETESA